MQANNGLTTKSFRFFGAMAVMLTYEELTSIAHTWATDDHNGRFLPTKGDHVYIAEVGDLDFDVDVSEVMTYGESGEFLGYSLHQLASVIVARYGDRTSGTHGAWAHVRINANAPLAQEVLRDISHLMAVAMSGLGADMIRVAFTTGGGYVGRPERPAILFDDAGVHYVMERIELLPTRGKISGQLIDPAINHNSVVSTIERDLATITSALMRLNRNDTVGKVDFSVKNGKLTIEVTRNPAGNFMTTTVVESSKFFTKDSNK